MSARKAEQASHHVLISARVGGAFHAHAYLACREEPTELMRGAANRLIQ
jgi:hypothetical protein